MHFRFLCAIVLTAASALAQDAITPNRKISLFNGKNLDGWSKWLRNNHHDDPKGVFTVTSKGEIRVSGEEWGGISTNSTYRNYHLVVEWRWGTKTWDARETKARDSGILIHGVGEDGAAGGVWLESIESQIIEGGAGDIILVAGKNRPTASATIRQEGKEMIWDTKGEAVTRDRGRFNWWGRSPEWKDELGFRGAKDIESKTGEWNRQEVFADGNRITYVLNGKVVNHAYDLANSAGKIQLQSEGAEIFFRKVEIEPVGKVPAPVSAEIPRREDHLYVRNR